MRLSVDHDPDDPNESKRVTMQGGRIIQNSQGSSQVQGLISIMTRQAHIRRIDCLFIHIN